MDHGGLSRRTDPENDLFYISDILSSLIAREILQLSSLLGVETAHTPGFWTPSCRPYWASIGSCINHSISHTCHSCGVPASASLHQTPTTLFLHLSHFCIIYQFVIVSLETAVSQRIFFAQTAIHATIHCNKLLVWFYVSGFLHITDTDSLLRFLLDIVLLTRSWFSCRPWSAVLAPLRDPEALR